MDVNNNSVVEWLYQERVIVCVLTLFTLSMTNEERVAEDPIAQVLDDLHRLLNRTDPIMVEDIDSVFNQIDDILVLDHEDIEFPSELLHLIEELGGRVDLNGSFVATTVKDNIALFMADTSPANPLLGVVVLRRDTDIFTEDSVRNFDVTTVPPDVWLANVSELITVVPASVRQESRRVSFVIFRDHSAFRTDDERFTANSLVVGVNVQNYTGLGPNESIMVYLGPRVEHMDSMDHQCGYWYFLEDGTGYWSEEGCDIFTYPSTLDPPQLPRCFCRQIGYFTMGLIPKPTTTTIATTTRSPESEIYRILFDIERLLESQTAPQVDDVLPVITRMDNILDLERDDLVFPSALLQAIDELGVRVDLNGSNTGTIVRYNIAMLIADTTPDNPVLGISLASRDTDTFTKDSLNFLYEIDPSLLNVNVNEIVLTLPSSVTRDSRRISFVVFRDGKAFSSRSSQHQSYTVNSRVISIQADNYLGLNDGEAMEIHIRPVTQTNRNERRVCTSWKFLEFRGYWSQEGCSLITTKDSRLLDTCRCAELAHFAEALTPRSVFSQSNEYALRVLAIIGSLLSVFGLFVIALTAVLLRSWRKSIRNQIWLQLCAALFIMSVCFLIIVFAEYDDYSVSCVSTGALFHFSTLALFCWMLVAGLNSYREMQSTPDNNPGQLKMLIVSVVTWGIPAVIVVFLVAFRSYTEPFEVKNPSSKFCRPSVIAHWISFVVPIAVTSITNFGTCFYVIHKLHIGPTNRHADIPEKDRMTVAYARVAYYLMFLTHLPPWIFDLFVFNVVVAYGFTLTATIQGFIVFVVIISTDTSMRNLWLHKLSRRSHGDTSVSIKPPTVD